MTAHLNVIGIVVEDMARSLAFYRAVGLQIPADDDAAPHVEVALGADVTLAFDTHETIRSFDPGFEPPTGSSHGFGLAFACESAAEVDSLYAQLTGQGYHGHLPPFDAFWGQRYATVHDPDGHSVDLYAALPVSD